MYTLFIYLCRNFLCRNSDADTAAHVPFQLEVVWLVLRCDESVTDEKVDENEAAVGLELSCLKSFDHVWHAHELWSACHLSGTYGE